MVVWCSDLGYLWRYLLCLILHWVVVRQLLDQGLRLCLDHNQGHSAVLHPTVDVGIYSVSVLVCQGVPAWCIMYLYDQKVQPYTLVVTEPPCGYFVCFSMLQSLINQTQPEEWFLNHESGLGDCDTLKALSTALFVMLHMIQEI